MEEFIKRIRERVSFFFYQKEVISLYAVQEELGKIDESNFFPFLKENFGLLKNLISTEDLDSIGEKKLFSQGIIYPGNIKSFLSDSNEIEIHDQRDLILFDIGEEIDEVDKMLISGCHIKYMANVSVKSLIYDTIVSCVEDCKNIDFSLSNIHSVKDCNISLREAPFYIIKDISLKNGCEGIIRFVEGNSHVRISCGEITKVSGCSEIEMTGGEIGVMQGNSRALILKGTVHTIAEKAVVLTKTEITARVCGDAILVRFQEGPEPEKPSKFYDGWYKKKREIISSEMGDRSIL